MPNGTSPSTTGPCVPSGVLCFRCQKQFSKVVKTLSGTVSSCVRTHKHAVACMGAHGCSCRRPRFLHRVHPTKTKTHRAKKQAAIYTAADHPIRALISKGVCKLTKRHPTKQDPSIVLVPGTHLPLSNVHGWVGPMAHPPQTFKSKEMGVQTRLIPPALVP